MATELVKIFVYIPKDLALELEEYCKKRDKPTSGAVRGMIARELKKANYKKKATDES